MEVLVKGEMDPLGLGRKEGESEEEADGAKERWRRDTRQAAVARALEELVNEAVRLLCSSFFPSCGGCRPFRRD